MIYQPIFESVQQHQVPEWFHDAKLGIFIHWGLFSVPAWATPSGDIDKQVVEKGWVDWFTNNAYAEWYLNSLRIEGSPTQRHHLETYGENFSYDDFVPMFNQAVEQWKPDEWAELFQKIGARYVVLTTKHHDGFLLWPSQSTSPQKTGPYATQRDLVGELTDAVRQRNMHMGLYYSGGLDWSFNEKPVREAVDVHGTIVQSPEFVAYSHAHWHELIDRYAPSVLWNDIGYPAAADVPELFAYFYNTVPHGIVNDRWSQAQPAGQRDAEEGIVALPVTHSDFTTPEYSAYDHIVEKKWESTRGIGHSFGYNQVEGVENYLSVEALIHSFVDIVSKNGNLLLNVGPTAEGAISTLQLERLLGLGAWLNVNGEAIFGTRPWVRFDGQTRDGIPTRYTQKEGSLYVILLGTPSSGEILLEKLEARTGATVSLVGSDASLAWQQRSDALSVELPGLNDSPAHVIKITPAPTLLE